MVTDLEPQSLPTGFRKRFEDECLVVDWTRPKGGISCFLILADVVMTFGCLFAFSSYFLDGRLDDGSEMPFWFPLAFAGAWIFLTILTARLTFCTKTFVFNEQQLLVESRVLCVRWQETIEKSAIRQIEIVKDGGENDDSFDTWGVSVECGKDGFYFFRSTKLHSLLWRAGPEQCEWLFQQVSAWEKQE